jgi:hypothetical protein
MVGISVLVDRDAHAITVPFEREDGHSFLCVPADLSGVREESFAFKPYYELFLAGREESVLLEPILPCT